MSKANPTDMVIGAAISPAYTHAGSASSLTPCFCNWLHFIAAMKKAKHKAFAAIIAETNGQIVKISMRKSYHKEADFA